MSNSNSSIGMSKGKEVSKLGESVLSTTTNIINFPPTPVDKIHSNVGLYLSRYV